MPFIKFHFVDRQKLASVSKTLTDGIQEVVKCPRENIVLEVIHSDYINNGSVDQGWPFVEVTWFQRPPEVQDEVAQIIYDCLENAGYESADVHFGYLVPENYYENGKKI